VAQDAVTLFGGGAAIELKGGDITLKASGEFTVKGAADWMGGASEPQCPPVLPAGVVKKSGEYHEQFHLVSVDGDTPMAHRKYRITGSNGQVWEGITDGDGLTERVYTDAAVDLQIEIMPADEIKRI
jgi:uncharacterized protein (DUF2345 family)